MAGAWCWSRLSPLRQHPEGSLLPGAAAFTVADGTYEFFKIEGISYPTGSQQRLAEEDLEEDLIPAVAPVVQTPHGTPLLCQPHLSGAELEGPARVVRKVEWQPG